MSEITVKEVFNNIFENWKISVLIIFFTFLIGISFVFLRVDNYIYNLQIDELSEKNFVNYNSFNFDFNILNNKLSEITSETSDIENIQSKEISRRMFFDKKEMLNLFIADLINRESMKTTLKNINLFDVNNFDTKKLYDEKLSDFVVNHFNIVYPVLTIEDKNLTEEKFRKSHIISFTIAKKFYDEEIFTSLIKVANAKTRDYLAQKYNEYFLFQKRKINYQIADLENEIVNLKLNYKLEKEARLRYLKEQSEIALVLDIADNMLFSDLFVQDNKNKKIELVSDNDPYYLRGYKAINKEISLIENRDSIDEYVYEVNPIKVKLSSIKNQRHLDRLNDSFNETHIVKDEFSAIDYSLADIKKNRIGISNFLVLFLSLVIGFTLSSLNIVFIILKKSVTDI